MTSTHVRASPARRATSGFQTASPRGSPSTRSAVNTRKPISPPPIRRQTTASSSRSPASATKGPTSNDHDDHAQTTYSPSRRPPITQSWATVSDIADKMKHLLEDIQHTHADAVSCAIESTVATEKRVLHGRDLFSQISCPTTTEKSDKTMRVKSKVYCAS